MLLLKQVFCQVYNQSISEIIIKQNSIEFTNFSFRLPFLFG